MAWCVLLRLSCVCANQPVMPAFEARCTLSAPLCLRISEALALLGSSSTLVAKQGVSMVAVMQVLCASNAAHDQVDPLTPAQGSSVGDRVTCKG